MSALIVGNVHTPARVHGVHGASGLTYWSCLARRAGLDGTWEAIEWASVPPGGVSGEHAHTRTEEVYFIVDGEGELLLDGRPHPVSAGSLALTRVGSRHGLRNVGRRPLNWLVIELLHPETAAVVRGRDGADRGGETVESTVVNLAERGGIDPRSVFASPLDEIRIVRLGPGEGTKLRADGREYTTFVLAGNGTATGGNGVTTDLAAGFGVTVPLGGEVVLEAGGDGLELFLASLEVRP